MALTVDYIYAYMGFLTRKNRAGGINAGEFGLSWNSAQNSYFSDLLGRFNKNTNSKLRLDTGLIENQTIMTKILPFTKPLTGQTISAGNGNKPADFAWTLALRIDGEKVFQIDHDTIWAVNQDVIDPPSVADGSYYYTEYLNYYAFLPNTVTAFDIDYIGNPPDVKWNFTLDGNNRQVYDPTGSVDPLWNNAECREITERALTSLGVSFNSDDFKQFGHIVTQTGDA